MVRRSGLNVFVALVGVVCAGALVVSIYPGVLNDLVFIALLLFFLFGLIGGAIGLVVLITLAAKGKLPALRIPWSHAVVSVVILFCSTYAALRYYLPRRIAFAVSRSSFERLVAQAPQSAEYATPLNQWCGVYRVDEYAADPRGGVYFRVYTGADGIGPDQMSYGFVHQPNAEGTPFGASRYRVFRLGNDWFWFRASDDWY